jgi:hypothetical protein
MSQKLKIPKDLISERALSKYLNEIESQMYIQSFKEIAGDKDI